MFDSQPTEEYTSEQRELLVRRTELQIEIAKAQLEVLPVMLEVLKNPTPEGEEALNLISSLRLSSLRREHSMVVLEILKTAVDLGGLKAMLPMFVTILASKIDISLILRALNIDSDQVKELTDFLKSYISL